MTITCTTSLLKTEDEYMQLEYDEYRRLCERRQSLFEKIPDDKPVTLYADFDLKKEHIQDGEELYDCTNALIDIAKRAISKTIQDFGGVTPPRFAIKTATNHSKISFHIIVPSHKTTKLQQHELFKRINKYINEMRDDKWAEDYLPIKPDRISQGFFDMSVYSTGRKMRTAYSTKEGESRPFEIIEGTFRDTVISMPYDDSESLHIPVPEKKPSIQGPVITGDDATEKYKDYMSIIPSSQWSPYMDWFRIQRASANIGIPFEIYDQFMRPCNGYDYENNLRIYQMPPDDKNGRLGWKYIYDTAYNANPTAKMQLDNKWKEPDMYITVADIQDPYVSAEKIKNTLKNNLILCKEKWYVLNDRNLWNEQKEPSYYIIRELRKYLDFSNLKIAEEITKTSDDEKKDKLVKTASEYLKCYKLISGSSYISVVSKFLRTHLKDDTFADKLDSNYDYLAFENGMMNLQTGHFRYGIKSSDFITCTIPHKYNPADSSKKAYLKSILLKILNNNPEHLEYFLSVIGYAFIGKAHLEKSIYFCVDKTVDGKGDNGKSFWFEIISELLPNYVYKTKSNFLEDANSKLHKQLAQLRGKRLVWLDEFGKNKTNAELMKVIGDGTICENEVMFGTTEIIRIMFKLFALTNHIPNIDPNETAVYNRYKQISYGSHFDRTGNRKEEDPENLLFIADSELKTKILNHYHDEVFALIIEYAGLYYTRKLPQIPEQFLQDTQDTQLSNDDFADWVNENLEKDPEGRIALKVIMFMSGKSEKKVKEGMKRLGFKYNKELKGIGKDETTGKYYKGGYEGITCPGLSLYPFVPL